MKLGPTSVLLRGNLGVSTQCDLPRMVLTTFIFPIRICCLDVSLWLLLRAKCPLIRPILRAFVRTLHIWESLKMGLEERRGGMILSPGLGEHLLLMLVVEWAVAWRRYLGVCVFTAAAEVFVEFLLSVVIILEVAHMRMHFKTLLFVLHLCNLSSLPHLRLPQLSLLSHLNPDARSLIYHCLLISLYIEPWVLLNFAYK